MSIKIFSKLCNNCFIYKQCGFMIKEKRLKKLYTQEKMSQILGISLRQYVRIDNEEDLPRKDILKKTYNRT